jgi:hypothetical protein
MDQGETRRELGEALVVLAASDDSAFLHDARTDLATTLSNYGFALRDAEMDDIVQYLVGRAEWSDQDIKDELRGRLGSAEGLRWF